MSIILLLVCCLLLMPAFAYSGTLNIGRIATEGNNTNYTAKVFDGIPTGLQEANSTNYTVTFEAYDYTAEENIVTPPPADDDDDDGGSTSHTSGTTTWSTPEPTTSEPVIKDISYGIVVSSQNKSIVVENKRAGIVLKDVEIKLADTITGEKTNVMIQIVQVGEPKTRIESLSFFGYQYHLIEINHDAVDNSEIKSAKIDFFVRDTWLQEHHLTKDDIYLFRYADGEWQELKTVYEDANETHYFYSALSPGLSSFMIGTREDVVEQQEPINPISVTGNAVHEQSDTTNNELATGNGEATTADTDESTGFLKGQLLFRLDNAIVLLVIGVLLVVIILAGVGFAMKHNHIHTTRKKEDYQRMPPSATTPTKPVVARSVEPDFVDTLVGHVDAKAHEIAQEVTRTIDETPATTTPTQSVPAQQATTTPHVSTTSVRQGTVVHTTDGQKNVVSQTPAKEAVQEATTPQQKKVAPVELDFTGHEEEALAHYVKQVMTAGYAKELYTKALLAKGWTKEQIDYCVNKIMEEQVSAPSRIKTK